MACWEGVGAVHKLKEHRQGRDWEGRATMPQDQHHLHFCIMEQSRRGVAGLGKQLKLGFQQSTAAGHARFSTETNLQDKTLHDRQPSTVEISISLFGIGRTDGRTDTNFRNRGSEPNDTLPTPPLTHSQIHSQAGKFPVWEDPPPKLQYNVSPYIYVDMYVYAFIYVNTCTHVYVCMYVRTYVRTCVRTYYVRTYVHTYVCIYECMHACMHACVHGMYVCMHECTYVCM